MLPRDRKGAFEQGSLEAAKWIALVAMTLDHYGKIVDPDVFTATHAVGRLAYPLFAGIIGVRLAARPDLGGVYLRRLLAWGFLSQPAFVLAGRSWFDGNILLTLALGVLCWVAVQALLPSQRGAARPGWDRSAGALLALVAVASLSFFVEFGPVGVLMPAATAAIARRDVRMALLAIGPLGLASNVVLEVPPLTWIDGWALLATPVAMVSATLSSRISRLPGWFFYAYYPAHLLALHFLDLAL